MKVIAIIQARMSSSRLPGKVLKKIADKTILDYIIDGLRESQAISEIVLATSQELSDNPIAQYAAQKSIHCHRGELNNVSARFLEVLKEIECDAFVRICGDSPLYRTNLMEEGIELLKANPDSDLVTNKLPRTFPVGQTVEIVSKTAYLKSYPLLQTEEEKEHVTLHFYNNPDKFKIINFQNPDGDTSEVRLSVDSPEDFEIISTLISTLSESEFYAYTSTELVNKVCQRTV